MDEAVAKNAPWEIMGARHGGITVSDLDRSLEFYVGLVGLELVWRREYVNDEIRQIVGVPEATSVDIAMLDIPGGGAQVELLEYKGCERKSGSDAAVRTTARATSACSSAISRHVMQSSPRRVFGSAPQGRSRCWKGRTRAARASTRLDPGRLHLRVPRATAACRRLTPRPDRGPAGRTTASARAVPPDAADPPLRGPRGRAFRAGRDLRHGAQLRRPGGDRGRCRRRDARDRLPGRPPPLARPPDRGRSRPAADDGRDVRQADRLLQGARRLDAHRRPLARHPRLQRHRRRRDPPCLRRGAHRDAARHRPGDPRLLRRRRRRPGRDPRGR